MKLIEFLTEDEIHIINHQILEGESMRHISNAYPKLTEIKRAVLWNHMRLIRFPPPTKILGYKNEPYQDEDQIGKMPKYTWESLSKEEKEFYYINPQTKW